MGQGNPFRCGNLFIYFKIFIYLYIFYFWLQWVFIVAHGLSLVVASGGYSSLRCAGFSLQWLLLSRSTGSRCTGFSGCGPRALLLHGMWDPPGPGLEPVPPALAGGFLTTVPPGKSASIYKIVRIWLLDWNLSFDSTVYSARVLELF